MKIFCVGLNYSRHADEMQLQKPEEPVIFLKPDSAILRNNNPFFLPEWAGQFDYEVEIVVKINRLGKCVGRQFANRYYDEVGVGIDFTARDLQLKLMSQGKPWEISKGFDQSAAISDFLSKTHFRDVQNINFRLDVNGVCRQKGNTHDMIFSVDEIISYVSQFYTLRMGDLIYTGTPVGVGPVHIGDRLTAYIEDQKMMDFMVK